MKKRIFSLFCTLALLLTPLPSAAALEGEAQRASDTLQTLGLLEGVAPTAPAEEGGNPLFAVADRTTAVTLLIRLSGADTSLVTDSVFQDVPETYRKDAAYAASQGWVSGIRPGVFAADQPVTANAWFTMLLRLLGWQDSKDDFSISEAARFAQRIGLVSRAYEGPLTRGDLCESAVEILRASYKDGDATVISKLVAQGRCAQATVNALGLTSRELTARQAADRYMSAVFCLDLYDSPEAVQKNDSTGQASGFFITPDGLAVTNYHSIDEAIRGVATLSTGEQYEVETVVWYDVDADLAVLRISRTSLKQTVTSAFAYLEVAGTADIRPGDVVYTLSNPLGLGLAVSSGVISAIARVVERYSQPCVMNTADISKGSSGGALINIYGRVVAVTSGAFQAGNNMYLAVPADMIKDVDKTVYGQTLQQVAAEQARLADAELSEAG